jgi:ABC-type multidrug transport system fused ATPase/permease subunit
MVSNKKQVEITSVGKILSVYWQYCRGIRKYFIPIAVVVIAESLFRVGVPYILGYVVDQFADGSTAAYYKKVILPYALGLLVIGSLVFYITCFFSHYWQTKVMVILTHRFRMDLYRHLQKLSSDFYQRFHVGEIASRLTSDMQFGVGPLFLQFVMIVFNFFIVIPSLYLMAQMSLKLLWLFIGIMAVFMVMVKLFVPVIRRVHREVRDESGRIHARITEDISVNILIKAFAQEYKCSEAVKERSQTFLKKSLYASRFSFLFSDAISTFLGITSPLLLILIGSLFVGEEITIGELTAAFGFWVTCVGPISGILNSIAQFFVCFASLDRILEFFKETPLIKDSSNAKPLMITKEGGGEVICENIRFRYPVSDGELYVNR